MSSTIIVGAALLIALIGIVLEVYASGITRGGGW